MAYNLHNQCTRDIFPTPEQGGHTFSGGFAKVVNREITSIGTGHWTLDSGHRLCRSRSLWTDRNSSLLFASRATPEGGEQGAKPATTTKSATVARSQLQASTKSSDEKKENKSCF